MLRLKINTWMSMDNILTFALSHNFNIQLLCIQDTCLRLIWVANIQRCAVCFWFFLNKQSNQLWIKCTQKKKRFSFSVFTSEYFQNWENLLYPCKYAVHYIIWLLLLLQYLFLFFASSFYPFIIKSDVKNAKVVSLQWDRGKTRRFFQKQINKINNENCNKQHNK